MIIFDRSLIAHYIVLVSEILPFGDWSDIEQEIVSTMVNENIYIHIIDYQEFMKYIKASKGRKDYFDAFLIMRIEKFIEEGAKIHMKSKFVMKE